MIVRIAFAAIAAFFVVGSVSAQLLTEKKFFTLPQYTTAGGKTIKSVRVGYETYGKLNAAGDNAVFIAHFFSGTSHAAGRYQADEKAAGGRGRLRRLDPGDGVGRGIPGAGRARDPRDRAGA